MKILFILEHYHPLIGGAEQLFKSLAESLVKEGHSVKVLTTKVNNLPANEEINGVIVKRVSVFNRYFFTLFSLPAAIREALKADVVHTTSYNAALPAFIASSIVRRKCIITFHEVWGKLWLDLPFTPRWVLKGHYWFEQLILRFSFERFIAVSEFTGIQLEENGVHPDRIKVIHNGMLYKEFEQLTHQPTGDFTFTFFGRLGISKGLDILLPAAARFFKSNPNTKLKLIIPQRPETLYGKVMGLISTLGLEEHVVLHHNLSKEELHKEITSSHCVVIPSYSEGFCFAATEAVSMGVPIISSGRGALQETVSGKFIELKELNEQELAEALEKAKLGEWDERPIKQFSMEETLSSYLGVYSGLKT